MRSELEPASSLPRVPRTTASARTLGGSLTVLVHLLLAWALLDRAGVSFEEPAALPPLQITLLGAPSASAAPALIEAKPALPKLNLEVPDLIVQERAKPALPPKPDPQPLPTAVALAAPATAAIAAGTAQMLRRSNGRTPDCQLPAWLTQMSAAISYSLQYPAQSRQLGESGTAYVRLSVARTGHVLESPLLQSSGHRSLDYEARDVVRRIGRFAPVPATDCVGYDVIVIDQPIRFGG